MTNFDVYRVESTGELLVWIGPEGRLDERPLTGVDTLVAEVEQGLEGPNPDLQQVGRTLYRWLDGERGWLTTVLAGRCGLALQIDLGQRLGQLPWELCCNEVFFLTGIYDHPFFPIRRVLARQAKRRPRANRPLRALFMVCAPEAVQPDLAHKAEETMILAAIQGLDVELVVEQRGSLEGLKDRLSECARGGFDVVHLSGFTGLEKDQPVLLMENRLGQRQEVTAEQLAKTLGRWPRLIFLSGRATNRVLGGYLAPFCDRLVAAGAPLVLGWSKPVEHRASLVAAELYKRLTEGAPLDRAIWHARGRVMEAESPHWQLLRCYGDDSPLTAVVTPPNHRGRAKLAPTGKDRDLALWREALDLHQKSGDLYGKALTLHQIGGVLIRRSEPSETLRLWRDALDLKEQLRKIRSTVAKMHAAAEGMVKEGSIRQAMDLWQDALEYMEDAGDLKGKAATLHDIAEVLAQQGEVERALELWQQSLALKHQIGDERGKATTLKAMAEFAAQQGDSAHAQALWQEAIVLLEQVGDLQGMAETQVQMAAFADLQESHGAGER